MTFTAKRVKNLTVPVLKLVLDEARYVKFTGVMHLGKEQKEKEGEAKKEPATLANIINLEDGAECQLIISAVVKSVLTDEYPNNSYVGKCFEITKRGRSPGKQYNAFDVVEIEDPATTGEPVTDAPAVEHEASPKHGKRR